MWEGLARMLERYRMRLYVGAAMAAALLLTGIANSLLMWLMRGNVEWQIFLFGELDALVVSAIVAPIVLGAFRRANDLQAINHGLQSEIAARERAQTALQASEERWRLYIEEANDLIFALDAAGRVTLANRAMCRALGYDCAELLGVNPLQFVPSECRANGAQALGKILRGESVPSFQAPMLTRDGRRLFLEVRGRILQQAGVVTGTFHIARDVTERRQTEMRLEYLGSHDALTDLYNRSFFEQELQRLEHSRHFPVSIVMCDVNGLKALNDQLGHAAGDELLRRAARVLTEAFRVEDIVARIGGDEFSILLPNTDAVTAHVVLARVRERLAKHNTEASPPLSVALGCATGNEPGALMQVLRDADAQMYCDKHGA